MNDIGRQLQPAPLITPEQRALEEKSLELWQHPRVQRALQKARALMLAGYGVDVPQQAVARFDTAMNEYGFSYVERVLCRDPNNFCVHYTCHPPYQRSDGSRVEGCRFYGENPDAVYRWGGILPGRTHRLVCRPVGPEVTAASFSLVGTYGGTTPGAAIELHQLQREEDGSFIITIDALPANGRPNHLQSTPATRLLLVREFLGDWSTETPLAMKLEADDASGDTSWDVDAALDEICYFMVEEVYLYFWMNHLYRNLEPNTVKGPAPAAAMGGSATMATSQGFFQLDEDQAVILEWDPSGAKLSSFSALDWWYIPIEEHRLQSSLNSSTAALDDDGKITAVLSPVDPGIVNWIETQGLRDVLVTGRWQELPARAAANGPSVTARLVRYSELDRYLPADTARCTPAERLQRNATRLAGYTRRTGDMRSQFANLE